MSAPKFAVGMRRVRPGVYVDRTGTLHVSAREVCQSFGLVPTPENQDAIERGFRRILAEEAPGIAVDWITRKEEF